jgi:hypothetical protein
VLWHACGVLCDARCVSCTERVPAFGDFGGRVAERSSVQEPCASVCKRGLLVGVVVQVVVVVVGALSWVLHAVFLALVLRSGTSVPLRGAALATSRVVVCTNIEFRVLQSYCRRRVCLMNEIVLPVV